MSHFFKVYKSLEHKETVVDDVQDASEAVKIITDCIENYKKNFGDEGKE